jgi:integrase
MSSATVRFARGAWIRRALRRAALPPLRFQDLRPMAGTLMHEAGLKRAQEILGHAREQTTLAIYTHSMRRTHEDSADKIADPAGLSNVGDNWLHGA